MGAVKALHGLTLAVAVAVVLAPRVATAQDDGAVLFETCKGCHAVANYKTNYPTYKVPKLGGQNAQYIVDALKGYRDGTRSHSTMHAQAATLSDGQMLAIGQYVQSLAQLAPGAGAPPEQAAQCAACHGGNGVAPAPNFPNLAGQHRDYLRHSLQQYKSQARQNAIMLGFAAPLTDDDIALLSAYYAGQTGLVTAH
jgi:cytochrome c553